LLRFNLFFEKSVLILKKVLKTFLKRWWRI